MTMARRAGVVLCALLASAAAGAQQQPQQLRLLPTLDTLFVSGSIGINTFRVPNIVTTANGTLVAIAQGKLNGRGDQGATSVLMRRSDTNGKTWEPPTVVLSDPTNSSEFDAVLAYEPAGDTLILVFQEMKTKELCGPCVQRVTRSTSFGRSWSAPTQLPSVNTTGGSGTSSGIVLTTGKHKGRLLVPQRHDCHDCSGTTNSFALISDDHGATFRGGALLPHGWSECQMAELQNGSVIITSRNDGDKTRQSSRLFARSDDGAETWAALWEASETDLPDPRCEASLLGDPPAGVLYFGNPSSAHSRSNYSVHASRDGGMSWELHAQVYAGGS
jgi:sialidase-1